MNFLDKKFFYRPPEVVAPELIGAYLVMKSENAPRKVAQITEVEAYLAEGDAASHGVRYGRTSAREALFQEGGTIYIHPMRSYVGMDIVTEGENIPSSVLIRAAKPVAGFRSDIDPKKHLKGPGKLCQGLGITQALYGQRVTDAACPLRIMPRDTLPEIKQSTRIGLSKNKAAVLRFFSD